MSSQDLVDDGPGDIRETEVTALVFVRQLLVIESEAMQEGSVQIVDMHLIVDDAHTELICGAVSQSAFDTAAGEQHRERIRMMVATGTGFLPRPRGLGQWR